MKKSYAAVRATVILLSGADLLTGSGELERYDPSNEGQWVPNDQGGNTK